MADRRRSKLVVHSVGFLGSSVLKTFSFSTNLRQRATPEPKRRGRIDSKDGSKFFPSQS